MATMKELLAADKLAVALGLIPERETSKMITRLRRLALGGSFTERVLKEEMKSTAKSTFSMLWKAELDFLKESLSLGKKDFVKLEELNWARLNSAIDERVKEALKTNSTASLRGFSSNMSEAITEQVDETQEVIGRSKGFVFQRHVEAGGCAWCQKQVREYENTGNWFRHANCRCFKVKKDAPKNIWNSTTEVDNGLQDFGWDEEEVDIFDSAW